MFHFSCVITLLSHRAIYFAAYSSTKERLNGVLEPDSMQVHMVSAGLAGKRQQQQQHDAFGFGAQGGVKIIGPDTSSTLCSCNI